MLGLLKLHKDIQMLIEHNQLSMGHARALSKLDEKTALKLAHKVVHEHVSVRKLESLIQGLKDKQEHTHQTTTQHVEKIEEKFHVKALHQKGKLTLSGDEDMIQTLISIIIDHQ